MLNEKAGVGKKPRLSFSAINQHPTTGFNFEKTIDSPDLPPMLVVMSQFDIDAMHEGVPYLIQIAKDAGLDYNFAWVAGFGHFYPTGAVSLGDDGIRISIGERVAKFLQKNLVD